MNIRLSASALLLLSLPLAGCNTLKTLEVTPAPGAQVLTAPGQKAQYHALATYQMGSASATLEDVTNSANWSAGNASVATINSTGLATGTGAGNTVITAELDGASGTSDITVDSATSGSAIPATLSVVPGASLAASTSVGQTTQFIAIGNLAGSSTMQDLTTSVTWLSSNVSVATISSRGLATGLSGGSTIITAELNGLTSSSTLSVSTLAAQPAIPATLAVIPAADIAQVTIVGETTQFLAIGNAVGSSTVTDLTKTVQWVSSDTSVATINSAGLATGVAAVGNQSITAITALLTSSNGTVTAATSTLAVTTGGGTVNLPTLSVYKTGNGTGTVTSSFGGISCGTGAGCTGSFSPGTVVTLTAIPSPGSSFGGWSSTCVPLAPNGVNPPYTAPYTCAVTVTTNISAGAVFNTP